MPTRGLGTPKIIMDAAFGYASVVNLPDKPFKFGFYDNESKKGEPTMIIEAKDIKLGSYQLIKLGEIKVSQRCLIWFSGKKLVDKSATWRAPLQPSGSGQRQSLRRICLAEVRQADPPHARGARRQ